MRICILTDVFYPGYKAGGPARSCLNIAYGLEQHAEVFVLTSDHDLGDTQPYPGIETDVWTRMSNFQVQYISPAGRGYMSMLKTLRSIQPDVIYLNSLFSPVFTVLPLLFLRAGRLKSRVVLAPRGMLKDSALRIKWPKKRIFLRLFKGMNVHQLVHFHATNADEALDIHRIFGKKARATILGGLPEISLLNQRKPLKKNGTTRFVYIARLHPIKNTLLLLQILKKCQFNTPVQLDIIGPAEDTAYTDQCRALATHLSAPVNVEFHGELPPPDSIKRLGEAHFFTMLTQGENFGHAIFEALALGKPVIISDQTPWRNLEASKAGWDLPLNNESAIIAALERAASMTETEYATWSDAAHDFAQQFVQQTDWSTSYLNLFSGAKA